MCNWYYYQCHIKTSSSNNPTRIRLSLRQSPQNANYVHRSCHVTLLPNDPFAQESLSIIYHMLCIYMLRALDDFQLSILSHNTFWPKLLYVSIFSSRYVCICDVSESTRLMFYSFSPPSDVRGLKMLLPRIMSTWSRVHVTHLHAIQHNQVKSTTSGAPVMLFRVMFSSA